MRQKIALLTVFSLMILPGCKADFASYNAVDRVNVKENISDVPSNEGAVTGIVQFAGKDNPEYYEIIYQQAREVGDIGVIKGAIVPHHLVGGYMPATLFNYLKKQKPSLIVIFGPNHYNKGGAKVITSLSDWETPFGRTKSEKNIALKLADNGAAKIDEDVFKTEHSVSALVPFISKFLPKTKILPIIFPYYTDTAILDNLLDDLTPLLPDDAVIVSSIDFSHYQNQPVAEFHDEVNRAVIRNFEYNRIQKMEIDSPASAYLILKLMEKFGTQKIGFEMSDNSANLMNNLAAEEITSYFSPFFIAGENVEDRLSSMLFFGDMMLDRNVKKQIDENGTDYLFEKLAGQENRFFMGTDLIHANLEGPFADLRRETTKEIAFRFDPALLPMLQKYNFGMFSQANNHTLDMSSAGFEESKKNLAAAEFDFYGSQYRVDDESLLIKKVGDYDIAFIGLNDTNSPVNFDAVKKLIQQGREKANFVVVNIHWGQEYKEVSNTRQRDLAHDMIDAGADTIIGHHPHVVQEMEIYKNRPIFYSLGNFVFDQYFSIPTQQSLGIGMIFKNSSVTAYIFPLEQNKSQVSQMIYDDKVKFMTDWIEKSSLNGRIFESGRIVIQL